MSKIKPVELSAKQRQENAQNKHTGGDFSLLVVCLLKGQIAYLCFPEVPGLKSIKDTAKQVRVCASWALAASLASRLTYT